MSEQGNLGAVITDPRIRRAVYAGFVVLGVVAGAITVGFATLGPAPQWVLVMNAVLAFLSAPVGSLAIANMRAIPARRGRKSDPEP